MSGRPNNAIPLGNDLGAQKLRAVCGYLVNDRVRLFIDARKSPVSSLRVMDQQQASVAVN